PHSLRANDSPTALTRPGIGGGGKTCRQTRTGNRTRRTVLRPRGPAARNALARLGLEPAGHDPYRGVRWAKGNDQGRRGREMAAQAQTAEGERRAGGDAHQRQRGQEGRP
ncbi:MAG: hypothetical protein ACK49X_01365, partial [Akkermansiaceae bacterium]